MILPDVERKHKEIIVELPQIALFKLFMHAATQQVIYTTLDETVDD